MKLRRIAAAGLCLLLLAGCTVRGEVPTPAPTPVPIATPSPAPAPPTDGAVFAELLAEVNAKNAALSAPDGALLEQYRYDLDSGMPLFDWEEWRSAPEEPPAVLPIQDARDEVDFLFRFLRTYYGLYAWFGGDEAFGAAQAEVLSVLEGREEIPTEEYEALLAESLQFINDMHFLLGGHGFVQRQILYCDEALEFIRRDGVFYQGDRRLLSVNGEEPTRAVKRAIGAEGELTWKLYLMAPPAESLTVRLEYEDGVEDVALYGSDSFICDLSGGDSVYHDSLYRGIPLIQMRHMPFGPDDDVGETLKGDGADKAAFLASAETIRDYPAAVVNLTQNSGGNGALPGIWFEALTGEQVAPHYCKLLRGYSQETEGGEHYQTVLPEAGFVRRTDGPLLLVLTGRGSASAAEAFTDLTRGVENTLIIGSNTTGCLTGDMTDTRPLPWSGLPLSRGNALFLWPEGYFTEGVGLEPDVYLTGQNQTIRLARFLDRYVIPNT